MKITKRAMAAAVVMLLSGSQAFAAPPASYDVRQPASATAVAYEYDHYYAEDPAASPSDAPAAAEASASDSCCEEEEEPVAEACKLFDCCFLKSMGLNISGWVQQGFTWNPDDPADRFNGPQTFNDRSNEYQLNQMYLFMERATDTGGGGWDLGGRVDLLYGTDYRFTTALGLDTSLQTGAPRWDSGRFYGLALPQAYVETAYNDLKVKWGHFYTPAGYETVTATGNFFYSHLYTHQYGEPFTHTGGLATYQTTENLAVIGGAVRGWDNWEDTNSNLSFVTGGTWTSTSKNTSLAYVLINGNEAPLGVIQKQNRYYNSFVFSQKLGEKWVYIAHHDLGIQNNALANGSDAEWYGFSQYLFYEMNDKWRAGFRWEAFRDDDGFRVAGLGTNPFTPGLGVTRGGFAGTFYDITLGLNYKPNANVILRPECRWDWYDGRPNAANQLPYDNGSDHNQVTMAMDLIVLY